MDKVKLIYAALDDGSSRVLCATDIDFNMKEWAKTKKKCFHELGIIRIYEVIMNVRTNADFNLSAK